MFWDREREEDLKIHGKNSKREEDDRKKKEIRKSALQGNIKRAVA